MALKVPRRIFWKRTIINLCGIANCIKLNHTQWLASNLSPFTDKLNWWMPSNLQYLMHYVFVCLVFFINECSNSESYNSFQPPGGKTQWKQWNIPVSALSTDLYSFWTPPGNQKSPEWRFSPFFGYISSIANTNTETYTGIDILCVQQQRTSINHTELRTTLC